MTFTLKTFRSRGGWLAARTKHIGASDAPGILGVSEWGLTPLKVWLSKVNPPKVEDPETLPEHLEWGHRHEPTIATAFAEKKDREVILPSQYFGKRAARHHICIDPEDTELAASLDRVQFEKGSKQPGVLEIKTSIFSESWTDEPPLDYLVQVQHQFKVTGMEWGDIAVLVRGSQFLTARVERNDEFIRKMVRFEKAFWELVKSGTPPAPAPMDSEVLSRLFPNEDPGSVVALAPAKWTALDGTELLADPDWLITRKVMLKQLANRVEAAEEECVAMLKALLGTAERGVLPNGSYASWKTVAARPKVKDVECPHCQKTFDYGEVPKHRRFNVHIPKKHKAELPELGLDVDPAVFSLEDRDGTKEITDGSAEGADNPADPEGEAQR